MMGKYTRKSLRSVGPGRVAGVARALVFAGVIAIVTLELSGCASWRTPSAEKSLREKWGIEITSLRTSERGHMIDFRYRVLDPAKAGMLADVRYNPVLIDQVTGIQMKIPNTPKLGPLRQSAKRLEAGKIYFMLFANSGLLVKPGSKVTIVIGDFRAENLIVE